MRILFATGNPHKVAEAVQMLSPLGHGVEPLLVDGEAPDFVEPQAEGLEAVAEMLAVLDDAVGEACEVRLQEMGPVPAG